MPRDDYQRCYNILQDVSKQLGAQDVKGDDNIAKLSIVGVGMRSHTGVANTMFKTLAENEINIQMISTSEIKISVIIDEKKLEIAVSALHRAFGLENMGE